MLSILLHRLYSLVRIAMTASTGMVLRSDRLLFVMESLAKFGSFRRALYTISGFREVCSLQEKLIYKLISNRILRHHYHAQRQKFPVAPPLQEWSRSSSPSCSTGADGNITLPSSSVSSMTDGSSALGACLPTSLHSARLCT
jgi:hypothetical protein